jgi:hypothetical protein
MAKCDNCQLLRKRVNGRKIMCRYRGLTHQRREDCNRYVAVSGKVDMLAWVGV